MSTIVGSLPVPEGAPGTTNSADGHRIDILLNCAGIQRRAPAAQFSDADWIEVLQVNLTSVFQLSRAVGEHMLSTPVGSSSSAASGSTTSSAPVTGRRGSIINVASLLSFSGGVYVPAYASAKGGIAQLTKALSNEWASKGITVNAIAPGYISTDMNVTLQRDESRSTEILSRIPMGRWGKPDDFKGVVVFLAGKSGAYVSGEVLTVDGGWMGR
ncbi:hypothetical protein MMC25_007166 [Agyrium rufum]|nr:hypothetical protein [Agyrium rufum]